MNIRLYTYPFTRKILLCFSYVTFLSKKVTKNSDWTNARRLVPRLCLNGAQSNKEFFI
jgi:hypothetical protein